MHDLRPEAIRDDVGKAIDRVGSERIAFKDYIPYISIPLAWSERKGENRAKNIRRVRSLSSGYFVSQSRKLKKGLHIYRGRITNSYLKSMDPYTPNY